MSFQTSSYKFNGEPRKYFEFKERFRAECDRFVKKDVLSQEYAVPMMLDPQIQIKIDNGLPLTLDEVRTVETIRKGNEEVENAAGQMKGILLSMIGPIVNGALQRHFLVGSKRSQVERALADLSVTYGTPTPTVSSEIIQEIEALTIAETVDQAKQLVAAMQTKYAELQKFPLHHQESQAASISKLFNRLGDAFIGAKRDINRSQMQNPLYTRDDAFQLVLSDCRLMLTSPTPQASRAGTPIPMNQPSGTPSARPTPSPVQAESSGQADSAFRTAYSDVENAAFDRGWAAAERSQQKRQREEANDQRGRPPRDFRQQPRTYQQPQQEQQRTYQQPQQQQQRSQSHTPPPRGPTPPTGRGTGGRTSAQRGKMYRRDSEPTSRTYAARDSYQEEEFQEEEYPEEYVEDDEGEELA